jgi:hypothetical protein
VSRLWLMARKGNRQFLPETRQTMLGPPFGLLHATEIILLFQ